MRQTVVLKKQALMIDKQAKVIETRSGWCAKRRTPCIDEQPGAIDISAKMMKDLHRLETQAERPCPEPDHDQNEDAGAASTLDMGPDARGKSSTDQQRP